MSCDQCGCEGNPYCTCESNLIKKRLDLLEVKIDYLFAKLKHDEEKNDITNTT